MFSEDSFLINARSTLFSDHCSQSIYRIHFPFLTELLFLVSYSTRFRNKAVVSERD